MAAWRWISIAGVIAAIVGCAAKKPAVVAPTATAIECRTVTLFDMNMEPPSSSVPVEWRRFAGHWGKGAWDGKLCHEIVVEAIYPDGTARVVDMQGYYDPWGEVPTAFRRKGRFDEDGALVIKIGSKEELVYRIDGGLVRGVRRSVQSGRELGVTLFPI